MISYIILLPVVIMDLKALQIQANKEANKRASQANVRILMKLSFLFLCCYF
jgi:hypothetical protein